MDVKGARLNISGAAAVCSAIVVAASGVVIVGCGIRSNLSLGELPIQAGGCELSGQADASQADASIDSSSDGNPWCGNGIIEPEHGEQCDRYALGGATCTSLAAGRGTLICGPECLFDFSMCEQREGDGGSRTADASRIDGSSAPRSSPTAAMEGETCTMQVAVESFFMVLFTSTGICQQPSAECIGGTADGFDISDILPPEVASLLSIPDEPGANCDPGLVCCVGDDECANVSQQLLGNFMVASLIESVECVPEGTCPASDTAKALTLGCPVGQSCCVQLPQIALDDAGRPVASSGVTDGGAP